MPAHEVGLLRADGEVGNPGGPSFQSGMATRMRAFN